MQGWLYGNGLIYSVANISANKISLKSAQSQSCIQFVVLHFK